MLEVGLYVTHPLAVSRRKSIQQLLEELPSSMHQRALRYKREGDAYNFILGRLLLKEGLRDLKIEGEIDHISFEKSGKPILESAFFNISHSSDRVLCAISQIGRLGIDIEKEEEVEFKNFESWFTAAEWESIHASSFPLKAFYRYWTRKESIIKALGLKLSYLNQIELDIRQAIFEENGKKWYLRELNPGDNYHGAICSEVELTIPIQMRYVDF